MHIDGSSRALRGFKWVQAQAGQGHTAFGSGPKGRATHVTLCVQHRFRGLRVEFWKVCLESWKEEPGRMATGSSIKLEGSVACVSTQHGGREVRALQSRGSRCLPAHAAWGQEDQAHNNLVHTSMNQQHL